MCNPSKVINLIGLETTIKEQFAESYAEDKKMWKEQGNKPICFDDWLDENWNDLIKEGFYND